LDLSNLCSLKKECTKAVVKNSEDFGRQEMPSYAQKKLEYMDRLARIENPVGEIGAPRNFYRDLVLEEDIFVERKGLDSESDELVVVDVENELNGVGGQRRGPGECGPKYHTFSKRMMLLPGFN
jgi:hypothetical protein